MKAKKLVTLLLSVFVLSGCSNFKGFAQPIGTPGTAVNPASINYYAHVGDTVVYAHEDATPGRPISEPNEPEQTGQEEFVGWSQKEKYETIDDIWQFQDPIPVNATAMTFYGQWEIPAKYVSVAFYKNKAAYDEFDTYHSVTLKEGEAIPAEQMPANPTEEGKTFLGWYVASDSSKAVVDLNAYRASLTQNEFIGKWDGEEPGPTPVVHVTSVALNETSKELKVGESFQLTATVLPENADDKSVSWSSSSSGVASVDQTGKVTAVATGDAVITVTTNDGNKTATCEVSVSVIPAADITITFMKFPKTSDPAYATVTIKAGQCIGDKMPSDPEAEHLKFLGWSATEEPLEVIPDVATVTWMESATLYGVWEDDIPSYGEYVLHVEANNEWKASGTNTMFIYAYNGASGKSNAAWPGVNMTFEGYDSTSDLDYYSYKVSEFYDTAIFVAVAKEGGESIRQTANISISKADCESKCAVLGNEADGEGHYNVSMWFNVYTVSFYNGSELLKTSYGYDGHKVMSFPENPSMTGKEFKGWSTDGTAANIVDFLTYVVTSNLTVYAVFGEPSPVTIYFQAKDWWNNDGATTYIYCWDADGGENAEFPGEDMTFVREYTDPIAGLVKLYSYVVAPQYIGVKFARHVGTEYYNETADLLMSDRGSNNAVWCNGSGADQIGWFTYEVE